MYSRSFDAKNVDSTPCIQAQSHLLWLFSSSGLVQPSKVVSCSIHYLSPQPQPCLSSLLSTTHSERVSTNSFPLIFAYPSFQCPSPSHGLSILVSMSFKSGCVKVSFSFTYILSTQPHSEHFHFIPLTF